MPAPVLGRARLEVCLLSAGVAVVRHLAHEPSRASSRSKLLAIQVIEMTFAVEGQVSWVKGPALDNPFEELASTSRVVGAECPWASSTEIACLVPTLCLASLHGRIVEDEGQQLSTRAAVHYGVRRQVYPDLGRWVITSVSWRFRVAKPRKCLLKIRLLRHP